MFHLILYAEHEFNASTFAARVTASTESDFYSCYCYLLLALLRGPLHGGANEEAMDSLLHLKHLNKLKHAVKEMLAKKVKIMGFGHRVYKISDPRSDIIKEWSKNCLHMHMMVISMLFQNALKKSCGMKKNYFLI